MRSGSIPVPNATRVTTLAKAERIIAAALAPSQPSTQDRAVAARAAALAVEARIELARGSETDGEAYGPEGPAARTPFDREAPRPDAILLNVRA